MHPKAIFLSIHGMRAFKRVDVSGNDKWRIARWHKEGAPILSATLGGHWVDGDMSFIPLYEECAWDEIPDASLDHLSPALMEEIIHAPESN